jgi:GntR family L-lactate dehydrogenase operon transcriptional regulator
MFVADLRDNIITQGGGAMLNMDDPRHITLLELIDSMGGSMGAPKAKTVLAGAGITVSEPTAGRILRDLEMEGLLEKNGSLGRRLTSVGVQRLNEYRQNTMKLERTRAFARTINPMEKDELIDLLIARRAIEAEIAKLAAKNITREDIGRLFIMIDKSKELFSERKSISGINTDFHGIIAKASGNRTLSAALELIWGGGEYAKKLERARYHSEQVVSDDHEKIVRALAAGLPDDAARAMGEHINNVLKEVENFPDSFMEDQPAAPM